MSLKLQPSPTVHPWEKDVRKSYGHMQHTRDGRPDLDRAFMAERAVTSNSLGMFGVFRMAMREFRAPVDRHRLLIFRSDVQCTST